MLPPFVQQSIKRLEGLLAEYEALTPESDMNAPMPSMSFGMGGAPLGKPWSPPLVKKSPELVIRMRQAITATAPDSAYARAAEEYKTLPRMLVAVNALLTDLKAGQYNNQRDLAHADVFSDLLDSADYLLSAKYKDPAAVVAGSALESHLRLLAQKHGIPTTNPTTNQPLTGGPLSQALQRAGVIEANTGKFLVAWQGLRNDAAHGNYGNYDDAKVLSMIVGIRGFMANHPA